MSSLLSAIPLDAIAYNSQGLVPAIAQDYLDATVLMMAWMNRESLEKTLTTGEAWYWSRSRQELWHKGATSGHIQKVRQIRYDCDSDAILLTIEQIGDIACHTGERSCFHQVNWQKSPPAADTRKSAKNRQKWSWPAKIMMAMLLLQKWPIFFIILSSLSPIIKFPCEMSIKNCKTGAGNQLSVISYQI
jgi:phosphoribosyl-AMP cyclohydrolase